MKFRHWLSRSSGFAAACRPLLTTLLVFGGVVLGHGLAEGYVDVHTHVACFDPAPEDAAAPTPPCYVGPELMKSYKLRFYPRYFSLREGEHYVKEARGKIPRVHQEWINQQRYLGNDGELHDRGEAQRYDVDSRSFYMFEHLSGLIQRNLSVKAAVVLAMDQVYDVVEDGQDFRAVADRAATQFYVSNDFVIEGLARLKQRFGKSNLLFGASVHPYRLTPEEIGPELGRLKASGAALVKLIAATHHFHTSTNCPGPDGENHCRSPDDSQRVHAEKARRRAAFYAALVAHDLPLLVHTDDEQSFAGGDHEDFTGAYKVLEPLRAGVTVIVAHAGSSGANSIHHPEVAGSSGGKEVSHYDQLKLLIDATRDGPDNGFKGRLFVDFSVLPSIRHAPLCVGPRKEDLYRITQEDYAEYWQGRLLFGSDYPMNHWLFRPKSCFTSYVVPGNSRYRRLFKKTGFKDDAATDLAKGEDRQFDHLVLMQRAFGVPEEAFRASEAFFRARGVIGPGFDAALPKAPRSRRLSP